MSHAIIWHSLKGKTTEPKADQRLPRVETGGGGLTVKGE